MLPLIILGLLPSAQALAIGVPSASSPASYTIAKASSSALPCAMNSTSNATALASQVVATGTVPAVPSTLSTASSAATATDNAPAEGTEGPKINDKYRSIFHWFKDGEGLHSRNEEHTVHPISPAATRGKKVRRDPGCGWFGIGCSDDPGVSGDLGKEFRKREEGDLDTRSMPIPRSENAAAVDGKEE